MIKAKTRLLRVTSKFFVASAVFERFRDGSWRLRECAPILRRTLEGVAVPKIPIVLERAGYSWEWVNHGQDQR